MAVPELRGFSDGVIVRVDHALVYKQLPQEADVVPKEMKFLDIEKILQK